VACAVAPITLKNESNAMTTAKTPFQSYTDLNARVQPLLSSLVDDAEAMRLRVRQNDDWVTLVDAGIEAPGGLEAGRRIAEICMGGIGQVTLTAEKTCAPFAWQVNVTSLQPVLACLASQYAGWNLEHKTGDKTYRALGSGPARTLGSREPLFDELGYRCAPAETCLVIESDELPPDGLCREIAEACGIVPEQLTVIVTPTSSFAGAVQVVARVLEVGLHKVHELGFPLDRVVDGGGAAPICPMSRDFLKAMGRTNDAIIYGGFVHLFVTGPDDDAEKLANELPSSASRDFGRPFAEVFKEYEYDFYKVDPHLFSPAEVVVSNVETGNTFHAGKRHPDLVARSFTG